MLQKLFSPQTIALVGASDRQGKMGNRFMQHILAGFQGEVFPVHPTAPTVCGVRAYRDLRDIPAEIDLMIPLVPAEKVVPIVRRSVHGQVKMILAIPSGFGEIPDGGEGLQRELLALAEERKFRIAGPNSVGLFNSRAGLNASMIPEFPAGGSGFSCVTQSGAFGMAVSLYAQDHEMDVAKFCDLGNTADVSLGEVLDFYRQDADTHVAGAYVEALVNEESFFGALGALARAKPVVLTKLGRTDAGERASMAHIGRVTTNGSFEQRARDCGAILTQTGLEMLDVVKGLSWQPTPAGGRVAIITGAGGIGVELCDLCREHGLNVPELSSELQAELRPHLPPYGGVQNPIDLTPLWWEFPKMYPPLMRALLSSHEVDVLLVAILDVATTVEPLMHAVVAVADEARAMGNDAKPIYVFFASPHTMREHRQILQRAHVPCYSSTESTVRAIAHISDVVQRSESARGRS